MQLKIRIELTMAVIIIFFLSKAILVAHVRLNLKSEFKIIKLYKVILIFVTNEIKLLEIVSHKL